MNMNKTIIESSIKDFKDSLKSFKGKKESFAKLFCKDSFLFLKNESYVVSVPCTIHEPFLESYKIDTSILYAWLDTFSPTEIVFLEIDDMLRFVVLKNNRPVALSLFKHQEEIANQEEESIPAPTPTILYEASIDSLKLLESLKKALLCVSTDKREYNKSLKNVAVKLQDSKITICATDSFCVFTRILPIDSKASIASEMQDCLLFSIEESKKLLDFLNKNKNKNTQINLVFLNNNSLVIHLNSLIFICNYVSSKELFYNFDMFSSCIKEKIQKVLTNPNLSFTETPSVQEFLKEIKTVSKNNNCIKLVLKNNLLKLESTNFKTGEKVSVILDIPFVANNIDDSKKYLLKFDASFLKKLTSSKTKQLVLFLCDDVRYNQSCILSDSDTVVSPMRLTLEDFV